MASGVPVSREAFFLAARSEKPWFVVCDLPSCKKVCAGLRCSRCKTGWYCSKEHQKADWPSHRAKCKTYAEAWEKKRIYLAEPVIQSQGGGAGAGASADDDNICSICLEPLLGEVAHLECGHAFCVGCIAQWRKTATSVENMARRFETFIDSGQAAPPPSINDWKCPLCCRETRSDPVADAYAECANLMCRANRHPKASAQRREGLELAGQRLEDLVHSVGGEESARELINVQLARAECASWLGDGERAVAILEAAVEEMEGGSDGNTRFTMNGRMVGNLTDWLVKFKLLLSECYIDLGRHDEALETMRGALRIMPGSNEREQNENRHNMRRCLHVHSVIQYHRGYYDESISSAEGAIEMNRTYQHVHKHKALSQRAKGDLDGAILTMRQAVTFEVPWGEQEVSDSNVALLEELRQERNDQRTSSSSSSSPSSSSSSSPTQSQGAPAESESSESAAAADDC